MLSPGQFYKKVPQDPIKNVRFRVKLFEAMLEDDDLRQGYLAMCEQDIVFFTSTCVWQFNPRKKGKEALGPFIPWDYQVESMLAEPTEDNPDNYGLLACYEHDQDAVVQKSRDMGISWWLLIMQVWICLFNDNIKALNISRNEDAVDSKDPDSLFWKIRFMLGWMTEWIKGPMVDQGLLLNFKRTNSYITGTASTSAAGVGGRAGLIFVDEFPRIKEDVAVRSGTASTSDCRYFNGTHQGTATELFKLTQTPEVIQFSYHWSQHPEKKKGLYRFNQATNKIEIIDTSYEFPHDYKFVMDGKPEGGPFPGLRSPWYDKKVVSIGSDVEAAQELDINPSGSVSQYFEPVIIRKLIIEYTRPAEWDGDVIFEEGAYRIKKREPGEKPGPLKLWFLLDRDNKPPAAAYKFGADLSQGLGRTNSCLTILNADTGERVGEYVRPDIYPEILAPMAVWLCKQFKDQEGNPAEFAWEDRGPGSRFGREIIALGFRNVYWHADPFRPFAKAKRDLPGWQPEASAKKALLDQYRSALRNKAFLNRSEVALEETMLFQLSPDGSKVYHSGSLDKRDPSGAGENHGDRVVADALAWMLAKDHAKRVEKRQAEEGPPILSKLWRRLRWQQEQAIEEV